MQPNGHTPLIIAAQVGNLAVVHCLVRLSAEVGAVKNFGGAALLESAINGRLRTVHYLLDGGSGCQHRRRQLRS
jgi:ankyrin repeat protein